jgi:hypothetical protein
MWGEREGMGAIGHGPLRGRFLPRGRCQVCSSHGLGGSTCSTSRHVNGAPGARGDVQLQVERVLARMFSKGLPLSGLSICERCWRWSALKRRWGHTMSCSCRWSKTTEQLDLSTSVPIEFILCSLVDVSHQGAGKNRFRWLVGDAGR